jgi:hypothetical protein
LELMKAMFNCGGNTRQWSAGVRCHEGNSLEPRKDNFWNLWCSLHLFFKREARLDCLWVIIYFMKRR